MELSRWIHDNETGEVFEQEYTPEELESLKIADEIMAEEIAQRGNP